MKLKETNEEGLDDIYSKYSTDVYRASLHIVKSEAIASEIMQQAFLNFYDSPESVRPECVRAYLITIARRLSLNYLRHAKFETGYAIYINEDGDEVVMEPMTESLEESYYENYSRTERRKLGDEIMECVKEHNEEWHTILYDMYYLEKDHDMIAEELGITKEVLYSRLYRAKQWIRKHYETQMNELEKEY